MATQRTVSEGDSEGSIFLGDFLEIITIVVLTRPVKMIKQFS